VLVVTFGVPLVVAGSMAMYGSQYFKDVAVFFVLTPLWIYTAAIVMTCLVRHAVYAAILSFAVMYLGVLLVVGAVRLRELVSGQIGWDDSWKPSATEMAAAMILTTLVSTLVAWLAVRYDWGRKSRY
jgi:hypothetical protein